MRSEVNDKFGLGLMLGMILPFVSWVIQWLLYWRAIVADEFFLRENKKIFYFGWPMSLNFSSEKDVDEIFFSDFLANLLFTTMVILIIYILVRLIVRGHVRK